ncbi:HAD family hydrolase [Roseivirga sp. BDSF3-8]|uniref:HAD family hydrolase n=1 Tax=Roseivirga sp. BDSF3-8 TaxID=3241598 RepID=UPI003531EFE7
MEEQTGHIDAIIFGLEGSIITSENSWDRCLRLLLSEYGVDYNRVRLKPEMAGRTLEECAAELKKRYPEYIKDDETYIAKRIRDFLADLIDKGLAYEEGFESFYAYAENNFKLAIATSMDRELFTKMDEKISFTRQFQAPVLFASSGKGKPDPSLFQEAAKELGVDLKDCLAIEDSPNGILAARHADAMVIGLAGTFSGQELEDLSGLPADKIFENYVEIEEWLRARGHSS